MNRWQDLFLQIEDCINGQVLAWIPDGDQACERFRKPSLFSISGKAPHKAVSKDTIRQWRILGLEKAGTDKSIFLPDSTTAASTSKALGQLPLKTVPVTTGRRRASTFATFYRKHVSSG